MSQQVADLSEQRAPVRALGELLLARSSAGRLSARWLVEPVSSVWTPQLARTGQLPELLVESLSVGARPSARLELLSPRGPRPPGRLELPLAGHSSPPVAAPWQPIGGVRGHQTA